MPATKSNFGKWLAGPPSWLAWFTFAISIVNFYFAFPRPPALEVLLTQKINVAFPPNEMDLVLPVFLYNRGSTGTVLIVQDAIATLTLEFETGPPETVVLPWIEVSKLLPRPPEKVDPTTDVKDDFYPENRSVPFAVEGKKTDFRNLRFIGPFKGNHSPAPVELTLVVTVLDIHKSKYMSQSLRYHVSKEQWQDSLDQKKWIWPTPR